MLTQTEQRKAARKFAKEWEGKGYEKGQSQVFWMTLLHDVLEVERPQDYLIFEYLDKVVAYPVFMKSYLQSKHKEILDIVTDEKLLLSKLQFAEVLA